jgi:NAD(P)-dependent dehydrogenase (short-subunit alcohol dehydrogenase family)
MTKAQKPTALIVGAGDHIGAEISKRFARDGYTVCMGRRNGDQLAPLIAEIESEGASAYGFTLDARSEEDVERVFAEIESDVGPLVKHFSPTSRPWVENRLQPPGVYCSLRG